MGGGHAGLGPRCCQVQPSTGRGTKAIQWRMQQPLQQMGEPYPPTQKKEPSVMSDTSWIKTERPGGWERGPPADPEGSRSSCTTGSRERRGSGEGTRGRALLLFKM